MPAFVLDYLVLVMLAFASLLATHLPRALSPSDSSTMQLIARFPMTDGLTFPCGDADHDGHQELYARRWEEHVWVLECRDGPAYDSTPLPFYAGVWQVTDLDRDGKADIICQARDTVRVYEARDPVSFPDSLVWWRDDGPISAHQTYTLDLDGDSALEFSYIGNSPFERRVLYECVGDNQYVEVDSMRARVHWARPIGQLAQTDDMDGDGLREAVVGASGEVAVFEAPVNDTCVRVWNQEMFPGGGGNADAVAFAPDMDGNGKDEFIVYCVSHDDEALVRVFEAVADDSFAVVWQTQVDGYDGAYYYRAEAGDVDGDSVAEFAVTTGRWLMLFRCTGPAEYSVMWQMRYIYEGLNLYDINSDGKCELLCAGRQESQVWEYLPVSIAEQERRRLEAVVLEPSVVRAGASVRLAGLPGGASVSVLDVSGRVVRADEGETVSTRGLRPGTYFLRVESGLSACGHAQAGPHSIQRKLLVVR